MAGLASKEIGFTVLLFLFCAFLSWAYATPFLLPSPRGAAFVGVHYLLPLLGLLALVGLVGIRGKVSRYTLFALPCYAVVLWLHFNVKAWVPFINPANYDAQFMAIDRQLHGLVDACIAIRGWLATWLPGINDLYMNGFMLLFYCSFIVHSMKTPDQFRTLFLSALLLQGLGGLCYLLMPAVGPFVYETGANPVLTQVQAHMLAVREAALAGGRAWLSANGAQEFVSPLAAMPSLHAGGGFLFLWFACKHCRVLLPLYVPLFAFILIGAIANRFHYIVDLPAGIALAALSIWLAHRLQAGLSWPAGVRWTALPALGAAVRGEGGLRPAPMPALAKAPARR